MPVGMVRHWKDFPTAQFWARAAEPTTALIGLEKDQYMLDSLALSQLLSCSQRSGCRNVVVEDGIVDERSGQEVRFGTSVKAGLALLRKRKGTFTFKYLRERTERLKPLNRVRYGVVTGSIQKGSHLSR